jgi:hypothetical protein
MPHPPAPALTVTDANAAGLPVTERQPADIGDADVIMRAAVGSGGAVQTLAVADPVIACAFQLLRLSVISLWPTTA